MVENLRGEVSDLKSQVSQLQQNSKLDATDQSTNNNQSDLLDRQQLAERLGVVEWSKSKDPEQISWKYAGANLFRRV
jgi:hypothetical protein